MDSGTTEQRKEDSGTTEQRREQHREDSGTTEQLREDSGTTEQRREQRREDSGITEQHREDLGTMKERKSHILKLLEDDGVSTVVLVGDTGMGKTRMAREISECAVREGSCSEFLWQSVYDHLSPSFITEEWGDEEEDINSNRDVKVTSITQVV